MTLTISILSQQPPGGRCRLYADYVEVIGACLGVMTELVYTELREAHGLGSPSILLNGQPVKPGDGVLLMPADLCAALTALGYAETALAGLAEALEAPLERLLEEQA